MGRDKSASERVVDDATDAVTLLQNQTYFNASSSRTEADQDMPHSTSQLLFYATTRKETVCLSHQ